MKNRMWSACAGAVAMLMLLPGSEASAQQKSEITLSRQPGIFYMPSHIMEKNKLIALRKRLGHDAYQDYRESIRLTDPDLYRLSELTSHRDHDA